MNDDQAELTNKRPASRRVADYLLARIDDGTYPVGASLPTYRQLASEHNVAVNTALAAVRLLREAGAVVIRPNAGAQVRDRTIDVDAASELHTIRVDLSDARAEVQRLSDVLGELEHRLANVAGSLGAEDT